MTDQERYPTESDNPGPLDGLVTFLRDANATHQEKAIGLLLASAKEHQYAVLDGQIDEESYVEWSEQTFRMTADVLGEMEE